MSTKNILKSILLAAIIGQFSAPSAMAVEMAFPQGEIVVGLASGTSIDTINGLYGTYVRHYLPLHDLYLLDAPATDLAALCEEIAGLPYVVFCHPNYLVDPMRGVQSSLPFTDEISSDDKYLDQPAADVLHLDAAHAISTGAGQVIGVVDGGVNMGHPAFNGRVVSGWDYVDNDADADEVPGGVNSGHGTFVAGVIHLTVPDATIRSYRVCDIDGEADGFVVAEAILQALADGCNVINVSLSTFEVHQAIATACQYARDQNVVVVCAAGNEYSEIGHYPGSDPNTMSVAAIDSGLALADYSSYGQHVTLVAPGTDIYAPFLDDGYAWWSGTSFAAPFAAAEVAMLRALDPQMSWDDLVALLVGTAVDVDQVNSDHTGLLGAGVLNPYGAILNFTGECGDVDGNLRADISDMSALIDALYLTASTSVPPPVVGLDGHDWATNNDLATLVASIFTSLSPCYCNLLFDESFPLTADTISISPVEVPANVDEWNVYISIRLTRPSSGLSVALNYELPGETIRLTQIELLSSPDLGPFVVQDSAGQRIAVSELQMYSNSTSPTAYDLARLTFSLAPADTARSIVFTPAALSNGAATHTNVISRLGGAGDHILGWEPQIVTSPHRPNVDSYGHLCLGVYRGDVNMDSDLVVDIVDVSVLIDHLFGSGLAEIAVGEADVAPRPHPDGILDISDLQMLVEHLFITLEPLPTCSD